MTKFYLLAFIFILFSSKSQTILNAYAKITSLNGARTTLTVSNVNEASHTFTVGGEVIIMQMQDNVIGTNTTNIASFGDLSTIANAGKYEIRSITSRLPATGTPTSITLSSALTNTFNTGANSSLQLITLRNMGANYTTTSSITGLAWNGNVGGVVAITVTNTLTLNHSIIADVIGFRKGLINSNAVAGACLPTLYITNSVSQAFKGEGIYKATDANFVNARAKILNGGGGGNEHNGGGGGGGNYTAGGAGGFGYSCGTGSNSGGLGGIALSAYTSGDRVFMGGGGGGGQQNNTVGLDGGAGGGIIFIKANKLITNTTCGAAIRISANGGSTANCGNDGAGGGGAAGSIILQVNSYSVTTTCTLAINANGGNGGNVSDGAEHGGGGGGGQGVVIFSSPQPTVNVVTTANNGTGGQNNNTNASSASGGGGTNNSGIFSSFANPLPIELLSFDGIIEDNKIKLYWSTATEINNDYFTVEKSNDGVNFNSIGNTKAAGNSLTKKDYVLYDFNSSSGINYYRLKQTDFDGTFTYSKIVSILNAHGISFTLFPNPASQNEPITITLDKSSFNDFFELSVYDITGKQIISQIIQDLSENNNTIQLNTIALAKGIYMVRFFNGYDNQTKKIIIN